MSSVNDAVGLLEDFVELSNKGVRVVRTAEGARRYKVPIGSVIIKHPDGSHDVISKGDGKHVPTNTQARKKAQAGEYRTAPKAAFNTKNGPRTARTSRGLAYDPDELARHKSRATRIAEKYADPTGKDESKQGTKSLHTTYDPETKKYSYSEERKALHNQIIDDLLKEADKRGVKKERKAIVAAGLPGAGKGTVLSKHAGVPESDYLTLDPDSIKAELVKRGGKVPGQSDSISAMDLAGITHEESSDLTKAAVARAEKEGYNIVHDVTLGGSNTQKHIDAMKARKKKGYKIHGVMVDIDKDTSTRRAGERYVHGRADYAEGKGLGGRLVPEGIGKEEAPEGYKSINAYNFDKVKPLFDSWDVYDNNTDGRDPKHVKSSKERIKLSHEWDDEIARLVAL